MLFRSNANPQGNLPFPRSGSTLSEAYVDVDGDGQLTPLDPLAVINYLNTPRGVGEGEATVDAAPVDAFFTALGAAGLGDLDTANAKSKRLRGSIG